MKQDYGISLSTCMYVYSNTVLLGWK